MGQGLAQHATTCGIDVILLDKDESFLEKAMERISNARRMARLMGQGDAQVNGTIRCETRHDSLSGANIVVENITESEPAKRALYETLRGVLPPEMIICANTSVFPITQIGAWYCRAENVVGVHFMNPVPQVGAAEVIRGEQTSDRAHRAALDLLKTLGKSAIEVGDAPGFVSNRVLMLSVNQAIQLVQDGLCSPRNADRVFVECFGHKMGLLEIADLIGLDTILLSLIALRDQLDSTVFEPAALLSKMVAEGKLGQKSGQGFYHYDQK
jgi:3-hydroxybutyryl-CoA dehydrogenase